MTHGDPLDLFDPDLLRRIDPFCDEFERNFRDGKTPDIDAFLRRAPDMDRAPLLGELVALDWQWRRGRGEVVALDVYRARYPELPPRQLARIESLPPVIGPVLPGALPPGGSSSVVKEARAPSVNDPYATQIVDSDSPPPGGVIDATASYVSETGDMPPDAPARKVRAANRVGDYEVLAEIARGGMGVVYRARQRGVNRVVALKMMLSGQFAGRQEIERFMIEAESAGQLDHPHIVPIHEVGEHGGQPFFSMGFVEGKSLKTLLADGPFAPRRAAEMIRTICGAVHYAHEKGIIHRDLKPANVLVDLRQQPRVTDFGLAKRIAADSGVTVTGQVMGTPSFMPPEQASGRVAEVGPLADVYSLGATLYNLITGRPPFQASTLTETLRQVTDDEPVVPRQLNRSIPRDLETICLKAMQKEPARRYETAASFGEDLRRFLENEPILARPVGRAERLWRWGRRHPARAGLYGVSVVSAIVLFAGALYASAEIGKREQDKENAQALAREREKTANVEKLNRVVRQIDEHRSRGRTGWTEEVAKDVNEAMQLPPAVRQIVALRSGLADAAGAVDLAAPKTLLDKYPAGAIAWHPHGKLLAVGLRRAPSHILPLQIRLVDTATGKKERNLWTPNSFFDWVRKSLKRFDWGLGELAVAEGIEQLAFSPDGRWLVAGTRFGRLYRWDLDKKDPATQPLDFPGDDGAIDFLAFRRDGRMLYATRRNEVRAWAVAGSRWEQVAENTQDGNQLGNLAVGTPGTWVACSQGRALRFLSDDRLNDLREPLVVNSLGAFASAPDGKTLFAAIDRKGIFFLPDDGIDAPVGRLRPRDAEEIHDDEVSQAIFSPDGTLLLTASEKAGQVRLWETISGRLVASVVVPGTVIRLTFAPDGRSFCVALDQRIETYGILGLDTQSFAALSPQPLAAFALTPDGKTLVTRSRAEGVALAAMDRDALTAWPCDDAGVAQVPSSTLTFARHADDIPPLFTDPSGTVAFVNARELRFWKPPAAAPGHFWIDVQEGFKTAAMGPGGGRIWVAQSPPVHQYFVPDDAAKPGDSNSSPSKPDNTLKAQAGDRISGLGNITSMAVGEDLLAVGWRGGALRFYDPGPNRELHQVRLSPASELTRITLARKNVLAAAGSAFGELFLLHPAKDYSQIRFKKSEVRQSTDARGDPVEVQDDDDRPHDDAVTGLVFLTESCLVSSSTDRTIRFWSIEGDEALPLFTLTMPRRVRQIELHPDGRRLIVLVDGERGLRVWHLDRLITRFVDLDMARGSTLPAMRPSRVPPTAASRSEPAPSPSEDIPPDSDALARRPIRTQYFAGNGQGRPMWVVYGESLLLDWGRDAPAPGVPGEHFAARCTGWLRAPKPGTYRLLLRTAGDADLYLDEAPLLQSGRRGSKWETDIVFDEHPHAVRIDFRKVGHGAAMELQWQTPDDPEPHAIPARFLFATAEAARAAVFTEESKLPRPLELAGIRGKGVASVFTADGSRVLTGAEDGYVYWHDAATGEKLRDSFAHDSRIGGVAISPDGKTAATGDHKGEILFWDLAKGNPLDEPVRRIDEPKRRITWLGFSPDGARLAVAYLNPNKIWLYETESGRDLGDCGNGDGAFDAAAWTSDGQRLIATEYMSSGPVGAFDIPRKMKSTLFRVPGGKPTGLALAPDGKRLAVAAEGFGGGVTLWDAATDELQRTLSASTLVQKLDWSPDGRWIAGAFDRGWRVWNAETGEEAWSAQDGTLFTSVRFSPDSKRLLVTGDRRDKKPAARIWTLPEAEP